MIKKALAFTLAEVLLTMTIIGVVAAMTIPTLHYQRVKKEYTTKLKNFYSKIDNAILDMELDHGSFRDMKLPPKGQGFDWYMTHLDPYIGHQYVNKNRNTVYYKDGSSLDTFFTGGCLDVYYDVNATKGPNRAGYDRFVFLFCFTDANRQSWFGNANIFWGTYGSGLSTAGLSRNTMINKCKNEYAWCTRLLQNDQWEFKDDYPFKF